MAPFAALRLLYLRRIVGTAFGAGGIERATGWASWIARNLFDLSPPARKRIEANLITAYGHTLSAAGRERLARAVFDNIARFWIEALFARRLLRPGSWDRFVGTAEPDAWRRLAAGRRPAILVSAYFGNFAVGAYALGQILGPVHVVIDRLDVPILGQWQDELYGHRNVRLVVREQATRRVPGILEAGGKVMIIGEHARRTGPAIEVPFLGGMRRCYPTVGVLAARHNARVIVFSTRRVSGPAFRFELRCHDVIDPEGLIAGFVETTAISGGRASRPPEGGQDARPPFAPAEYGSSAANGTSKPDPVHAITERYMAALEAMIRETPEQYDWTRPA